MAGVKELIRIEENGTLSFGDYELSEKTKKSDVPFEGDVYKVKTYADITKLEKNGLFVYESVPGTAVYNFSEKADGVSFEVEGKTDCQITLGMEENAEYAITINGADAGTMKTQMGGKLVLSIEASEAAASVKVVKL